MSNFENHPIVCRDNLENTKENEKVTYSSPTRQKNSFILCPPTLGQYKFKFSIIYEQQQQRDEM